MGGEVQVQGGVVKELAKRVSGYFADYLETGFLRQKAPRRRIVSTTDAGFRASMRTNPYPTLDRDLWAALSKPSEEDLSVTITPRKYTRPISDVLLKIIREHVEAISDLPLEKIRTAVCECATSTYTNAMDNPEEWVGKVREVLSSSVADQVVRPLIAHLNGPLTQQAYWVMDTLYGAEADLVERVSGDLSRGLPDALAKLLATGKDALLIDAVTYFLTAEGVRAALMEFFRSFAAADAYSEFRDLHTYVSTGEGLQLYLYVGSIKYNATSYPLFFIPIDIESRQGGEGFVLKLVNHLYAHKRAIDFVLEELAAEHRRAWVAPINDRITYVQPGLSIYEEARGQFKLVARAMDLGGQIELGSSATDASTTSVKLSSALYLAAADRAEESLLNDYAEILDLVNRGGSEVVSLFEGIIRDVMVDNPKSIGAAIEQQWDTLPMIERMVFDSPIPLNEEQRKILMAVANPEGRIILVKGPPGTGKSHTITAIAADCAFKQKSCLVLSDKREALEVVYEKLSEAMSRVRHNADFPNPLLRLGRQDANYKKLTSTQSILQVSAYVKSMKANRANIEEERRGVTNSLKDGISRTVASLGSVLIKDIQTFHEEEAQLEALAKRIVPLLLACTDDSLLPEIEAAAPLAAVAEGYLRAILPEGDFSTNSLMARARRDTAMIEFAANHSTERWSMFESLDTMQARQIGDIALQYRQLKMPIFGYLFRGAKVRELEAQLNQLPTNGPIVLKEAIPTLLNIAAGVHSLKQKLETAGVDMPVSVAYRDLARGAQLPPGASELIKLVALFRRLNPEIVDALVDKPSVDPKAWGLALTFLVRWITLCRAFHAAPSIDYVGAKTHLERLNTSIMNSHVDARLLDFVDNNKTDAKAIAGVIAHRQKFPEEKFDLLRKSFPVQIAGIREFGEFMPLATDLIDVLVIDEASQVSVAQALPALLRAKKIVVLGDDKQFSNVKSSNASIEQNDKYRSELVNYVRRNISDRADVLQRLSMFDVKKSILDFALLTASYEVMLRKHFRSYAELIGYSSTTFYGGTLQAIKVRARPVSEVIRFMQIDPAGKTATRVTNEAEGEFILSQLLELIHLPEPPTVGVITPFREQQTYLSKLFFGHRAARDFEDKLQLKVMTFDSCQGIERATIYYSMVATRGNDALNYVFPVSIDDAEQAVEDKLKVQRLNVGFSRAQETVWFVHSKPLEEFRGSIAHAMNYYANTLEKSASIPTGGTDPRSPMEPKVLEWIKQSRFYQLNTNRVTIIPQFGIGKYLKQLDQEYKHPAWKVDFLLLYRTDNGSVPIVIEYDGFAYHFARNKDVHVGNHERYLNEADVERQLTLEQYGYRFLRISRFTMGKDPVETISRRLYAMVEQAQLESASTAVDNVKGLAEGLSSKTMKTCNKCGQIKSLEQFFDPTLRNGAGGEGRNCLQCKGF